ncbi:MAG: DNA-binding protein [Clostridiales bacterium]|nr:DNA-binding protein [Clostridiales bacterium]
MDKSVDKKVKIGLLFSFYRNMLTDRQIECIDLYYNEDLSLAEISEHLGITRQGVRDNIKRAEHTMYDTEERLGLAARFLGISEKLEKIDDIIREIEQSPNIRTLSDDIKHKINKILMIISEINSDEQTR